MTALPLAPRAEPRRLLRLVRGLRCAENDRRSGLRWYNDLYQSLGERALQSGQPGERMPELILHDVEGNHQQLSRCWEQTTSAARDDVAKLRSEPATCPGPATEDPIDAWMTAPGDAFGSAPNVAILVDPDGRIAVKQGWFEPQEMARAWCEKLASHCRLPNVTSRVKRTRFGCGVALKEFK